LKSTYLEIQDGGQPPNFQSLTGYNSGVHCTISLKFSTAFQHVIANTLVQGQMVEGQGHSLRNRQHGFTAKLVGLSYLFNLSGGRFHGHAAPNSCQAEVHKQYFQNKKNPENPRTSGAMSFGLRNPMLSQVHAF